MTDVAILVNTCDLYEDAWEPFFSLFKIQWTDCPYDIFLNTENKTYNCEYLNVRTITTGSDGAWTERIKKAVKEIDAEYILFMLEDFFLLQQVEQVKFDSIVSQMKKDREVGFVFFTPVGVRYDIQWEPDTFFSDVSKYADYRINACVGLWRKDFLLKMLYLKGSPWEFEHNATRLSWLLKDRCCVMNPEYSSILSYSILISEGYGITQRKWLPKNKELFSQYNIDVNYSGLGFLEKKNKSAVVNKKTEKPIQKKIFGSIKRRIQKYKKILKKNIRYLKDVLFLKPKFTNYCREIADKR